MYPAGGSRRSPARAAAGERSVRVVVVGSGFAGSLIARIAARLGHRVTLVERGRHPRFALGESSTPLAAIALERLADRYAVADLRDLAAYGRWVGSMPGVRRGLKRGFTFYGHRAGVPYRNSSDNSHRLLVAASPDDAVADAHWLRADVDHHLVRLAVAAGVDYLDRTELTECVRRASGWRLAGSREARPVALEADIVLDATGAAGFLARVLRLAPGPRVTPLDTELVYGHFEGVRPFDEVADACFPAGPYPDERAAVHHLLEEGWMYQLPFDHGAVSAGIVLVRGGEGVGAGADTPADRWRRLLARYPTLADQFAEASPVGRIGAVPRLQWRLGHAAGEGWAILPHGYAFFSPMFSTGIAWSLVAVERLARGLEGGEGEPGATLDRYARLLAREADFLERMIACAYVLRADFDAFTAYSFLYFAAASYNEARQRLMSPPDDVPWCWDGFLGSTDAVIRAAVRDVVQRVAAASFVGSDAEAVVARAIAGRNVAGLATSARRRMYPVDLDDLVASAGLLGLSRDALRRALPKLRGSAGAPLT